MNHMNITVIVGMLMILIARHPCIAKTSPSLMPYTMYRTYVMLQNPHHVRRPSITE
jgi:hypothetical protein